MSNFIDLIKEMSSGVGAATDDTVVLCEEAQRNRRRWKAVGRDPLEHRRPAGIISFALGSAQIHLDDAWRTEQQAAAVVAAVKATTLTGRLTAVGKERLSAVRTVPIRERRPFLPFCS